MAVSEKLENKKMQKRLNLENAAYQLFTTKGIQETSISDIVSLANVAKGTFYLYYKDKADLLGKLIINHSARVLMEAMLFARNRHEDFIERIIIITDYIIEYFKKDKALLSVINKNFSWSLVINHMNSSESKELNTLFNEYNRNLKERGYSPQEAEQLLFLIVDLIGVACYSAILNNQPATIDELKPTLFLAIRKILS